VRASREVCLVMGDVTAFIVKKVDRAGYSKICYNNGNRRCFMDVEPFFQKTGHLF
jgi:hypothetical protein